MNNEIKEAYCSFEVAKLLKEKGFDVQCRSHYELALTSKKDSQDGYSGSFGWKKGELNVQSDFCTNSSLKKYYDDKNWTACTRPTHQIAIEWLRVNFGIWIYLQPQSLIGLHPTNNYYYSIVHKDIVHSNYYDTPQQATEAALLYTLKNLIK